MQAVRACKWGMKEARLNVVDRLAHIATENSASHILIAGDVFDAGTPEESAIRQFLEKLEAASETFWVLLPSNHDPLASETLWARLETRKPANVLLATKGRSINLNENVTLLPSPGEVKRPGEDTTRWMDEEPVIDGQIRIGLAHGAVLSFGEDGASDVISPERATSAKLDYMALGDQCICTFMRITPRRLHSGRMSRWHSGRIGLTSLPPAAGNARLQGR